MKLNEAKRRYYSSEMWCESGSEEGAVFKDSERLGEIEILRGESKHGKHVTLKFPDISYMSEDDIVNCAKAAAKEMLDTVKRDISHIRNENKVILAVCLGNRNITSDAQGPLCGDIINATYHLKENASRLYEIMGGYRLAVLIPGTEGQSGLDPSLTLTSVAQKIKPDVIIAIDALSAGCDEYIGKSFQISSAGITPGSGVGNSKRKISKENTGFPTIGIGIPTVISSSTLIYNALKSSGVEDIPKEMENILENNRSFFVSPKNTDLITNAAAKLHAASIEKFCELLSHS